MHISKSVWDALKRAVERDDQPTFTTLVEAIVHQHLRDERARQAAADRARSGDPPWLASCR